MLIKYINFVSPKNRILLTRQSYASLYRPVVLGVVTSLSLLAIKLNGRIEHDEISISLFFLLYTVSVLWLLFSTYRYAQTITGIGKKILILPAIYLALPLVAYGVIMARLLNLISWIWSNPRYLGDTSVMDTYVK
ncbi:hypothetical protein [Vibrio cincinnatiensis]|uniref:hypothetical protein n=1 Tax=Vibrio cincinnatiensis TaxID=675 RepID=UPI001EDF07E1|nr:hypothetical protein [Vibrio cincinnatiensis]MCG3734516.1 hypothetical protein [Vibrio cincinnatiensis]MCG3741623.1 hypothetical protein [Vibrio cincinnatiensis]MCG3744806.1 hypothetical protein [Vibrio cincinnatiensis]